MKISMNQNRKKVSLEELVEEYIRQCKIKNCTEATMDYYEVLYNTYMKPFFGKDVRVETITKDKVDSFILNLRGKKLKDKSINTILSSLRTLLYYAMAKGYLDEYKISLVRAEKPIVETYTQYELEQILKKPNMNNCDFTEYRNWVIINFLLSTGCRLSTLINIKIVDVDFSNGLIRYDKTKNRRQQLVPLSNSLNQVLVEYLQYREGEQEQWLFCNQYGEKLTKGAVQTAITRYNRKRGISHTGIHRFRHTFAKNWILNGGDVFRLQKMLGHSNMEMVRNYVNIFDTDIENIDTFLVTATIGAKKEKMRI